MSKANARSGKGWRAVVWVTLILTLLILIAALYIQSTYRLKLSREELRLHTIGASPRFFAYHFSDRTEREGEIYEITDTFYAQRERAYVPYGEIPAALIDAFVAIEDQHFFEHKGVNWYRTLVAGANYILGFSDRFGASTITQQLVKNLTGEDQVSVKRKLQEILYARDLERMLEKSEIMELYLNVICFSDHCDGIGAAAEHYFSKSPAELTVAECAAIAAITNNPSYYNPIRHPENNLKRRNLILSQMHEMGSLDDLSYGEAINEPLELRVDDLSNREGINSWYTDMVIADVIADLMAERGMSRAAASHLVYTGGLRIDVAVDEEIQAIVEDYYLHRVRMPRNEQGEAAESALIVIDAKTGDILGVAGAVGEKKGNHLQNFATQTLRPPGSTIKPLSVYAPALEEGLINWSSVYDDVPVKFGEQGKSVWPKNANGIYRGLTNIPYAVAHSTNTVALRVLEELGLPKAFDYAKNRFGLSHMKERDCDLAALALGQLSNGVTLREVTAAYTAFADRGVYHPYRSYYRVLDADGNLLLSKPDEGKIILSTANAAIMTKMLEGCIKEGTSTSVTLRTLTECAGKTGTTNRDGDRWFVGYTPDVVCGVWSGYEYPEPLVGKNISTAIWDGVMNRIVSSRPSERKFSMPSSLVYVTYCKDSGKLLCEACEKDPRGTRAESGWFEKGSEPREFCDCHVLCRYNTEVGGVCHGDCSHACCEEIGLIRVERHLPSQVFISDAEYVWRGDPTLMPPNPSQEEAYFAPMLEDYCGISRKKQQFNRSATAHKENASLID